MKTKHGFMGELYSLLFLVIVMFFSKPILSQSEWSCSVEESPEAQLLNFGNNSECEDFLEYIPDAHTQIVYVKVNFHFIAKEDPFNPMNFTATWDGVDMDNNYTGYDYSEQIINTVNSRLSGNFQMNMPPGNSTPVIDRKIRYVLMGVYFHESDIYWGTTNGSALLNNFGVNPGEEINIFFQSHNIDGNGNLGGVANTSGNRRSVIRGLWNGYYEGDTTSWWGGAWTVLHETGHNFTLQHTMKNGGGTCLLNWDDGFTDTPTQGEILAMGLSDPCCTSAFTSPTCSNNLMDYSTEDVITPQQLGMIHYQLTHDMINYVLRDFCEKDVNFNETISSNEDITWNNIRIFRGDLILEPGAKLTIRCDVYMPHLGKIIVKKGAKLTIDGGRVTNYCGALWSGIEVWGNSAEDQLPESNQGQVIVKNQGTIEWAEIGINLIGIQEDGTYDWSKTGGIVKCTEANFLNNLRSVNFMSYHNFGSNGQIANRSYFRNSHFEITDVTRFPNEAHDCFISMWNVNGIKIYGCDFTNSAIGISLEQRGNGIFSIASTYKVGDHCEAIITSGVSCPEEQLVRSRFENLNYAIRSAGWMKTMLLSVEHAQFINNRGGVFLSGFGQSQIIKNDFDWVEITEPDQEETFGVYLQECVGYEVEENFFDAHDGEETYGIAVNNSGQYSTLVYRNIFHRCKVASMVYGLNRVLSNSDDHPGLEWNCNIYGEAGNDSKMNYYGIGLWDDASHSSYQGVLSESGAAGNLFYPECDPDNSFDAEVRELKLLEQENPSYYDYIHTPNDATEPLCRTFGIGLLNTGITNWIYGQQGVCIKNISTEKPSSLHHNLVESSHSVYIGLKTAYDGYVNNGTGPELMTLIKDPSVTSIEVRNALLDAAPKVADELLIAALHRTPAMDGWHMAQALLANSPLKAGVLADLARTDYMEFYKNLVSYNQPNGLSSRAMMAMDATHYKNLQDNAKDDLIRSYSGDYEEVTYWPNLIQISNDLSYCILPWEKAAIYFEKGDFSSANAILSNYSGDDARCEMLKLALDMQQNGMGAIGLSSNQKIELESIANDPKNMMNSTASLVLEFWGGEKYEEFLSLPEGREFKSQRTQESEGVLEIQAINAFPNPAFENIRLTCLLPAESEDAKLTIYNSQGVIIDVLNAKQTNGIFELDTKDWSTGIYLAELVADGIKLGSISFSILN